MVLALLAPFMAGASWPDGGIAPFYFLAISFIAWWKGWKWLKNRTQKRAS
jgi:hypothetical protein